MLQFLSPLSVPFILTQKLLLLQVDFLGRFIGSLDININIF